MSPTSIVSSILLTLPSTVSSTTNSYVLNVVRYVESINNFYINHHHYGKSRFRKFQLMWYILMSATSLIFFSLLTLLTTVPSTANSDILNVVRYVESIKNFHATTTTTAYQILDEENSNRSDTSLCQWPPWSSPPCCPCRPQCPWPPTLMYLMWSDMIEI